MDQELRALLRDLRDGRVGDDVLAQVRARLAVAHGDEVAALLEAPSDADAVLALLDGADAPLAGMLRAALEDADGGERVADVADGVMAQLAGLAAPVAAAVAHEAGRPPELAAGLDPDALPVAPAVVWEAGRPPEVAATFDAAAVPVAAAVVHEAGASPDLARAFDPGALPIAEAVRAEAGAVDVVPAVLGELGIDGALPEAWLSALLDRALPVDRHVEAAERVGRDPALRARLAAWADLGRRLREDLAVEGGKAPDVWRDVAPAIGLSDPDHVPGWDETLLGEAVRDRAGSVDVADAVMARVRRDAVGVAPELPAPANQGRWLGAAVLGVVAAAAALLLAVRLVGVQGGVGPDWIERPVTFASAEELQLDQARYGENQSVFVEVPTKAEDPVIVWVDDGGSL